MAQRPRVSTDGVKGYLLEEAIAFLISKAGYRLITAAEDDWFDLKDGSNGLQVRGRGGFHQADVLGELAWTPAFGNPIRLFLEAKWRGTNGGLRLGMRDVRHAVGIVQDVNQTISVTRPLGMAEVGSYRLYSYAYKYALCSSSGFSKNAQNYALAHQISLIDLSAAAFQTLRVQVDQAAIELAGYYDEVANRQGPRPRLIKTLRNTMRSLLWDGDFEDIDSGLRRHLRPLIAEIRRMGELFVGVTSTGFVILMRASNPTLMIRHMRQGRDPTTEITYRLDREITSADWTIHVHSPRVETCTLSFSLPTQILASVLDQEERRPRRAALNAKEEHFSTITVFRIADRKSLVASLNLDRDWLRYAREALAE